MDLCVFDILKKKLNSDGSRRNECVYFFNFLKYDFYYFYGHAKFCFCTLYFQYPLAFRNFCTMLHNSSRSSIWYNMSQHE
jgi:hypothetical protein